MPANQLIFQDAIKTRDSITNSQRREIKRLYSEWAEEVGEKAAYYSQHSAPSAALSERQYRELENALIAASERVSDSVETIVKKNIRHMSDAVVCSNTKWLTSLGIDSATVYATTSSIPDAIVQRLVTGQIYKSGWSLSGSLWSDNQKTQKQIYEIVAGGMAQNKSIYEMSKDLERWINPAKMKPWNLVNAKGRKIYPRAVDYNSQRLARTLVQHSYQQSFVETTKDNDLIESYTWIANGSRVCPMCSDLHGKIFAKDELPLDHPNGMCVWEPNLAKDWLHQLNKMWHS
jgi:SPP1 gp7 family putative phage head morphogenesis protein